MDGHFVQLLTIANAVYISPTDSDSDALDWNTSMLLKQTQVDCSRSMEKLLRVGPPVHAAGSHGITKSTNRLTVCIFNLKTYLKIHELSTRLESSLFSVMSDTRN